MSLKKLNDPSQVSGWNSRMDFPKDRYTIRCIEWDTTPSRGGNPMVHLTWEICCGTPVQFGERQLDVDGLKIEQWLVTKVKAEDGEAWDTEKSDKAFSRFAEILRLLGWDENDDIDDENPPGKFFESKVADAIIRANKETSLNAAGKPIKDALGKDVITYRLTIEQILGLSSVDTNRPY